MSLIAAAELADRLADPSLAADTVVCDVRFSLADHDQGRREYAAAHLPGARFVDLHHQLAGSSGGGRHPLPTLADFAATLGELGIHESSYVVAYDDAGGATASRLWWMLRSIGHGQVAVLDGGIQAWTADGRPVTADVEHWEPTTYPTPAEWTGMVDADVVAEAIELGGTIVDARAPERYRGDVEPIDQRAGHIPTAVNHYHLGNLGPDGKHQPGPSLAAHFAGIGESPIVYCGSGVTACHLLLVMSLVGVPRARLYPGSWSEWSSDPTRPIATGDA